MLVRRGHAEAERKGRGDAETRRQSKAGRVSPGGHAGSVTPGKVCPMQVAASPPPRVSPSPRLPLPASPPPRVTVAREGALA
jgi:hypothetical protein